MPYFSLIGHLRGAGRFLRLAPRQNLLHQLDAPRFFSIDRVVRQAALILALLSLLLVFAREEVDRL